jgi:iron complex outermembrane receptor protein
MKLLKNPVLPLFSLVVGAHAIDSLERTIVEAERVEDDPAAVSVLSRDSLDLFQTESLSDLSGLVPGFHVVSADSRGYGQVVAMRGSTNTLFFGPPALGMTIDGLPLADAFSYPSELLQLDEVRVHRGPHGPYFGRNAPTGMLEMRTAAPGDSLRHEIGLEYGSYDRIAARGLSSGPLGDHFAYSVQLFHDQRDGFVRNVLLGAETDDREATGGLFNLYWRPDADTEVRLRLFAEQIDDGSQRLSRLDSPDPFTVASDNPGRTELDRYQISLHTRKHLAAGTLETIHGYQNWELNPSTVDLDLANRFTPSPAFTGGFPVPVDATSGIYQNQDIFSNEIRFTSPEDGALRWQAGLFQMWTENSGVTRRSTLAPFGPGGLFVPILWENNTFDIEQLNLAAYGNLAWDLTEALTLDAGLRVDYHESEISRVQNAAAPVPGVTPVSGSRDEWFVSPVLGLTYAVTPAVDLFFRSSVGNKPGGFTAYSNDPRFISFGRETNWSNEIGLEYDCPAHDLRFGLRAFHDQIDDYQFNQGSPFTTDFVILNAGEVTASGIEFDAVWAPVEGLAIRGSAGYTDVEFDSFRDPYTGAVFNGNTVPFVPEYTGSLGIRYQLPCGFYAQAAARLAGRTHYDAANTPGFTQGSHVTCDAEIGYDAGHFSIALYGTNLFDESYYSFINPQIQAGSPGDPQQFGVRVRTTF